MKNILFVCRVDVGPLMDVIPRSHPGSVIKAAHLGCRHDDLSGVSFESPSSGLVHSQEDREKE